MEVFIILIGIFIAASFTIGLLTLDDKLMALGFGGACMGVLVLVVVCGIESNFSCTDEEATAAPQVEETIKEPTVVVKPALEVLKPTPLQIEEQIIADTITITEETLLSPDKVEELTEAIDECFRAKVAVLSMTENNRYLTIKDYDEVTKLILDCKYDKMRSTINK